MMLVMGGIEATKIIRNRKKNGGLRIVALTADAMSDHTQSCIEAGMDEVLCKPVNLDSLYQVLSRIDPVQS